MNSMKNMNLIDLMEDFDTVEECRGALEKLRWPNGVECPRCRSKKISKIVKRNQYDCDSCRYQFSVTSGTIFHDSHLPLYKWFFAIYLMCESKKGISANQISRTLKISYRTAWYLCHRIRKAVEEAIDRPKLTGTVEVDETYVGGRYDKRRKRGRKELPIVMGMFQRDGKFEARQIRTNSKRILVSVIQDRIANSAKVYTDQLPAYKSVKKTHEHASVNHHLDEWVRGDVHTNNVESAWSLFKRSLVGAFHQVSQKHLDKYFDEFEWRFNNRENPFLFRDTLVKLLESENMEYKRLVAS